MTYSAFLAELVRWLVVLSEGEMVRTLSPAPSPACGRGELGLVAEVTVACEHHGQAMLVRRSDDFFVAHRSARLNHCLGARLCQHVHAVAEREEGIRRDHGIGQAQAGVLRLDAGDAGGVDAAHLA